jgi:sulfonate transport system substrate-binding protein
VAENHFDEAAEIIAERYRITKVVALYVLKDSSHIMLDPGQADYENQVQSLQHFLAWAIKNGDDFYSTKPLTDQQLYDFVDKRFFEGGPFYVDTSDQAIGLNPKSASSSDSSKGLVASSQPN